MSSATTLGYVNTDELKQALKAGRLRDVFEDSGLRVISGFPGCYSIYGIESCSISRCGEGHRLPDELRTALEAYWNRGIAHRGPPSIYTIQVTAQRVFPSGAGTAGNCVLIRNTGGGRAVALGQQLGLITDVEWRAPHLRLLGLDLERKQSIYEYVGETSRS